MYILIVMTLEITVSYHWRTKTNKQTQKPTHPVFLKMWTILEVRSYCCHGMFTYEWNCLLFESFICEQKFPKGMPHPHAVSCQPENSSKNRFKKLCACEYTCHFLEILKSSILQIGATREAQEVYFGSSKSFESLTFSKRMLLNPRTN